MSFRILQCVAAISVGCLFSSPLFSAVPERFPQIQPLAASSLVLDIAHAGQHLVAVGERGHVLVFNDKWQQVPTPTSVQLTKVFFLTEKTRLGCRSRCHHFAHSRWRPNVVVTNAVD